MGTGNVIFGVAKQTALGSLAANPTFAHGLIDGGLASDPKQEADPLTSASTSPLGAFRERIESASDFKARVMAKSIGLYLFNILGNIVTTGASPYTHTLTEGSSSPYLSLFEKALDGTIIAHKDCKVEELSIEWDENKPLDLSVKTNDGVLSFPATFTPTVDEAGSVLYYSPVGGTFKYDVDSGTPVVASIQGGTITMKRSNDPQFNSGAIEAASVYSGGLSIECKFKVRPEDVALWRTIVTGTTSGAAAATTPLYGSFEHTFVLGSDSLKISAPRVGFLADKPKANPANGLAEVELSGICYSNAGATPLTAVLINTQATY